MAALYPAARLMGWRLRERTAGEPMIWRARWSFANKDYSGGSVIFIEYVLWRELDANFPDQLNEMRVG
jgi:hypothetical protein